ncbi:MAG TPA: hypothetical protein VGB11_08425, partial [Candidatus Bathyarchaeia archaeon]
KFNPTKVSLRLFLAHMFNLAEHHNRILCAMLKLQQTLTITINVENNGENAQLVQEREAQETPRTNAAEDTAQSP